MGSIKEINIKNRTYYFFDDMIHIKNFDPNLLKPHNMTIRVRFVFEEDGKYYPQVFLDECLYEL